MAKEEEMILCPFLPLPRRKVRTKGWDDRGRAARVRARGSGGARCKGSRGPRRPAKPGCAHSSSGCKGKQLPTRARVSCRYSDHETPGWSHVVTRPGRAGPRGREGRPTRKARLPPPNSAAQTGRSRHPRPRPASAKAPDLVPPEIKPNKP